ncbi:MAG: hypothetical protein KA195_00280 [Burkholderiaceae bacterium]|nr:hypothetical protein [Burkholderiaceae bacterium]
MKRTGFRPRAPRREQRDPDRVRSVPTVTPGAFRAPQPVASAPAAQVAKAAPVRSEAYRRLVASLPCIACGIQGYSQAAHLPPEAKGMKQSDLLTFPLCCTRVGIPGCHQDYDQYRLFPREAAMTVGRAWAADTQRRIHAMGMWPKSLQFPEQTNASTTPIAINSVVK